VEASNF